MTRLTCEALRQDPDHTMVMVHYIPREQWYIAGRSLADYGQNAFRLEVTIPTKPILKPPS